MPLSRLLALLSLVAVSPGWAMPLEIPLRVPLETIRQALGTQLAASSAQPGVVYREGRCRFLTLGAPKLEAQGGELHLAAPGTAALGVDLFGNCQSAARWKGTVQFRLRPELDAAGRLRVRILDSKLSEEGGTDALPLIWDLSKRHLHPRLERFRYDLGASRSALEQVVRGAAPAEHAAALETVLGGIQILPPRVAPDAVVVPVALNLPDAWQSAPAPVMLAAAPLTDTELEALDAALQPWDAFLAYSLKQIALDSEDAALRRRLFDLLLESRYRLSEILSGEVRVAGDPVRELFLEAWSELRAILANARYTLFVDAGDALAALDRAAPGLAMTVSADGLRQLARSLRPGTTGDPLAYDWTVDPQLKRLFGVEEPSGAETAPPQRSWLDFFVAPARASTEAEQRALDRWVPRREELDAFESRIAAVLQKVGAAELQRSSLAAPYDRIYRDMVPATALIESCWRQYVVRSGKVTYLRSGAGSVGLMQVNQVVWRGFYDRERLRWDTAYNARAGAQILLRYFKDYAIPFAEKNGDANHVARAAYAVYNAGPRAVGRFLKSPPHPREARVDERLKSLYEGIASGGEVDLRNCGVMSADASAGR